MRRVVMKRPVTLSLVAMIIVAGASACGAEPMATLAPTPTALPTPTPTAVPTPTPTPLPVQPPGWEEVTVHTLCLEVEQSYPEGKGPEPIAEAAGRILARVGLQVVDEEALCDATLTIILTGEALGAYYTDAGSCYTGAEVSGQVSLTAPDRPPLTLPISGRYPTPFSVIGCPPQPSGAPFGKAWPEALLDGLAHPWGPQVLIQALEDESVWVRRSAAYALGEIGPEDGVIPALIQALWDEERLVSGAASRALGDIGPEAVPALIQALGDEDGRVREVAARALGWIGPEAREAIPALIQALEDEEWWVRVAAARALGAITGQDFDEDADAWQQWWQQQ
jgi:hypothetical protein